MVELLLGGILMFSLFNRMSTHWNILLLGLLEVILVSTFSREGIKGLKLRRNFD